LPKLTQAAKLERRAQFLEAARRCAATKGYRDFTVDDVCLEAGLSKGAFYTYFDSKQALLLALLDEETEDLDRLLRELEGDEAGYVDRLRRFTEEMLASAENPGTVQLRTDLWAAALTDQVVRKSLVANIERRRRRLRSWIDAAVDTRELDPIPANALASILLALADGLLLHGGLDPDGFRWVNIRKALDALLEGVGRGRV